jgi:hypothetical protein
MLALLHAARGPTIRAMLIRMGVVGLALLVGLVVVRVVGQRISTARYHEAAMIETERLEPALMLRVALTNARRRSGLRGQR